VAESTTWEFAQLTSSAVNPFYRRPFISIADLTKWDGEDRRRKEGMNIIIAAPLMVEDFVRRAGSD
jgi:hypothetical protein